MPIKFECPHCKSKLNVADALAGKRGKCPKCEKVVSIPTSQSGNAAPTRPSSASTPVPTQGSKPAAPGSSAPPAVPPKKPTSASTPPPPPKPAPPKSAPGANAAGSSAPPRSSPPKLPAGNSKPPAGKASAAVKEKPVSRTVPNADNGPAGTPPKGSSPPSTAVVTEPGNGSQSAAAPPLPPEDAEAAAAAAFADEPVAEEELTQIEFDCEWCGFKIKVPVTEANKRIPCPSDDCRRIVKVPEPPKKDKDAWRGKKARPGMKPTEIVPDDVMGGSKTTISEDTRKEFREEPPMTWGQISSRVIVLGCLVGVLGWGVLRSYQWWVGRSETQALRTALAAAADKKLAPELRATLYRAAAVYTARTMGPASAADADKQLKEGFGLLSGEAARPIAGHGQLPEERDFVLIDLALGQIELAGGKEEIEAGTRISWDEAQRAAVAALKGIRSTEARMEGVLEVVRRLIARKENERALALTNQVFTSEDEKADALARVGLEFFRAGQEAMVKQAASQVLPMFQVKGKQIRECKAPSVIALAEVVKSEKRPQTADNVQGLAITRIGRAEGLAARGDLDKARLEVGQLEGDRDAHLRALIGLAAANPDALSKALDHANLQKTPWQAYRLVRLGLKAGLPSDKLQAAASNITDPVLRGRAQLQLFRAQLEQSRKVVEDAEVQKVGAPDSSTQAVARLLQAEHNTHSSGGWARAVQKWPESARPFGQLGVALGMQDKAPVTR